MTWRGQWIWTDGDAAPRNAYVHFRRKLNLDFVPAKALAWLTADSRYIFWINGRTVCRGPSRCDPRWQSYDEVDIAPYLRQGENSLAVLVHHYGESSFSYIQGRGGFLFECNALNLWSDPSWRVRLSDAWCRELSRMRIQLDFPEVYDARQEPVGWTEPGYDDSRWPSAVTIGAPSCAPWTSLEKREIPFMREQEISGAAVVESGQTEVLEQVEVLDLQKFFRTDLWMSSGHVAYAATYIQSPSDQSIELDIVSVTPVKAWLNEQTVSQQSIVGRQVFALILREGWNRLMLKLPQGDHQWKTAVRLRGAERLSRSWQMPDGGANPQPGWAISGAYQILKPDEFDVILEVPYPPEVDENAPEFKSWQRLNDARGEARFGGGSERAVAMLMEYSEHRRGMELQLNNTLPATLNSGEYLLLDFGREVVGYPRLRIKSGSSGFLDIGYAERLVDGMLKPNRGEVAYADRVATRNGRQTWESFEKRAFRYMQIDCRKASDGVMIEDAVINFSTYPVELRGRFECSDPLLNRIWDVGGYTVNLCMEDAYVDGPWRERGMWWGDASVEFLANAVAFGDSALMRRGLRLIGQSQDEEGALAGVYPTSYPNRMLPSFTLMWIHSLWDYYWLTGDDALVRELYPKVQLALKWFARYLSPHKLLADMPGWGFIDWAPIDQRGEQSAINALFCKALEVTGAMSDIVNARPLAIRYRALAREVKAAFNRRLWNPERNAYADCRDGDELSSIVSQQTNSLALLFDIAPPERQQIVLDTICGQDPSQDPEGILAAATPYFSYYLLSAVHRGGRHSFALNYMRSRWKKMLDGGATTWWERWDAEGSCCHGWAAGPTWLLTTQILGVTPTAASWREFDVRPHPCGLDWARGTVPTPNGEIAVEWEVVNGRCQTNVRAPAGLRYRVLPPSTVL